MKIAVSFVPHHFTPKKEPCPIQYPFDRRLGGPNSWSEHSGEEKNRSEYIRIIIYKESVAQHIKPIDILMVAIHIH
jgi:hypothetical protein